MSSETPQPSSAASQRWAALVELLRARLLEFIREPAAVFWVYVFPLIMVVALGVAFRNQGVEKIVVDVEQGAGAEGIVRALKTDRRMVAQVADREATRRRLRIGKTELVVIGSTRSSNDTVYTYLFDPTRPDSILARNTVDDILQREAGRADVLATDDRVFDEPGGRYIDFLVPGLLGMGLMGGGMWGVGFAIVDMRIRKQLKRFLATPMRRSDFLLAMMLSRFLFTTPEVLFLLVFAYLAFGVVIHGSIALVVLIILIGAFQFAGIGLLVASRAQTLETVSGLMNLVMLPMWIFSGMFFSTERFPAIMQPVIACLPLTPLIAALRAVMLEGAGPAAISGQLLLIAGWGLVTFVTALRIFRWS